MVAKWTSLFRNHLQRTGKVVTGWADPRNRRVYQGSSGCNAGRKRCSTIWTKGAPEIKILLRDSSRHGTLNYYQSGTRASQVKQSNRSTRLSVGSYFENMLTANASYSLRFNSVIESRDSSLINALEAVPKIKWEGVKTIKSIKSICNITKGPICTTCQGEKIVNRFRI